LELRISKTNDFDVSGNGQAPAWKNCEWQPMPRVAGDREYNTRSKVLYSDCGIYFLVECQDRHLSCLERKDFDDIFLDDVIEVFLWPCQSQTMYFEYEVSPMEVELPILVANNGESFMGWRPWKYTGTRKVIKKTVVVGGNKEPGAHVQSWSAEFFIPFELFNGMSNSRPGRGTRWRANMYRIDYDGDKAAHWAWCPDTGANFHRIHKFGTFVFD
jgi:hypothetical protein